eukprot:GSChrysophyteH1.ASY1.ANO1.3263.1 assembled CDS
MLQQMSSGTNFSALQKNLQLAYSSNLDDQRVAAENLAKILEKTSFEAISFGPLAHALCRLLPSPDIDVAANAAKATKLLVLGDALRQQVNAVSMPTVICAAISQWEDEERPLRELLGALQTLCVDKTCVRGVLVAGIISNLIDYTQASDQEVAVLSISVLANVLSHGDTLLLQEPAVIDELRPAMPVLLEIAHAAGESPQRFYATAAIANAASHPTLAEVLLEEGALSVCQKLEQLTESKLHILGSRFGQCTQTALYLLSQGRHGDPAEADVKYTFKYGTQPSMELQLEGLWSGKHTKLLLICATLWFCTVLYVLSPAVFSVRSAA